MAELKTKRPYVRKKPIEAPVQPAVTELPIKKATEAAPNYEELFKNLQDSFKIKCQQFDELANAYRALEMKYNASADAVMTLLDAHSVGLQLLFPPKGGR